MSKDVKVSTQNQNIFAIAKNMSDNDIGLVIIIDDDNNRIPVDIITERGIIKILSSLKPDLLQTPVKEFVSHLVFHYRYRLLSQMH
jgi:CBS domain-containing protein